MFLKNNYFLLLLVMLKRYFFIVFVAILNHGFAQLSSSEYEAQVIGGKEQVEQVLQTQLTLPKVLLSANFDEHVTVLIWTLLVKPRILLLRVVIIMP